MQKPVSRSLLNQERTKEDPGKLDAAWSLLKDRRLALLALLAIMLAIHLWSLTRYPVPDVDEAWLGGRAWSFIETRHAFGPLDQGVKERFEGHWTFFPWTPVFFQSLALRPFSEPVLLPLRVVSLAFGLMLLAAVYTIGNRLDGPRLGRLGVLLTSVSLPFLYSAHLARHDIITAAFGFTAIALYLNNRPPRIWVSLVCGLCAGLAFEVHAHGAIYVPAILALQFHDLRWSILRRHQFWSFLIGTGLGLAIYALLHIVRYPRSYSEFYQIVYTITHSPPILTLDPRVILDSVLDTFPTVAYHVLIPFIAWSVVALARRHGEADRKLLVLNVALFVAVAALIRNKWFYYAILSSPAIDLLIAAWLLKEMEQPWRGRLRDFARRSLVLGTCATAIIVNLSVLRTDSRGAYQEARRTVSQAIQPGESVMGSQTYWFGLHDHVYYSWENLVYYQRYAPGSTLEDAFRELQPDILIIDRHFDRAIHDDPGGSLYSRHLRVPRSELEALLSRRAALVTVFDVDLYGPIRIYRFRW
jgi:hypothetical protein